MERASEVAQPFQLTRVLGTSCVNKLRKAGEHDALGDFNRLYSSGVIGVCQFLDVQTPKP